MASNVRLPPVYQRVFITPLVEGQTTSLSSPVAGGYEGGNTTFRHYQAEFLQPVRAANVAAAKKNAPRRSSMSDYGHSHSSKPARSPATHRPVPPSTSKRSHSTRRRKPGVDSNGASGAVNGADAGNNSGAAAEARESNAPLGAVASSTLEIVEDLRDLLKESAASNWGDEELLRHLNTAYNEVFGMETLLFEDWGIKRYTDSVVSGTDEYDLPGDIKKLRMVEYLYDSEWHKIKRVNYVDRHRYDLRRDTASDPRHLFYYEFGEKIGLIPTPGISIADGLRLTYNPVAGELHKGTAQGGAATTITLASTATSHNDAYNDMYIHIVSGTGAGELQKITDYVGGTKVATVASWGTNPDNTSVYAVVPKTRDAFAKCIVALAAAYAVSFMDNLGFSNMMALYERRLTNAKKEVDVRNREPRYPRHVPRHQSLLDF